MNFQYSFANIFVLAHYYFIQWHLKEHDKFRKKSTVSVCAKLAGQTPPPSLQIQRTKILSRNSAIRVVPASTGFSPATPAGGREGDPWEVSLVHGIPLRTPEKPGMFHHILNTGNPQTKVKHRKPLDKGPTPSNQVRGEF